MSQRPPQSWNVLEVLNWTAEFFGKRGALSARLDAELLLCEVLDLDRIHLYVQYDRPLTDDEKKLFRSLVARRGRGEPVQYILGEQEFWSLSFKVTRDVLIPRPETEILVAEAVRIARLCDADELRVADVGTGSGAIALAFVSEIANAHVVAGDISPAALEVAAENARAQGAEGRVTFVAGDGLLPLRSCGSGAPFDLVLSNPPYITDGEFDGLMREVREWEPRQALTAGAAGLDVIRPLVAACLEGALRPGGSLLIEIGSRDQADAVESLLSQSGFSEVRTLDDYSRYARVVVACA